MRPDVHTAKRHRILTITTPEGPTLEFALAPAGDRATAFILDSLIQIGIGLASGIVAIMLASFSPHAGVALVLLVIFLLRFFYFPWFEIRKQGQTPGKRRLKLRVIDAEGGPLTAEAIFARNLTREVECLIPLTILFAPDAFLPGETGLFRFLALIWALVFLFFPVLNRGRVRIGDLVGGTRVVLAPTAVLPPDLARAAAPLSAPNAAPLEVLPEFTFTRAQLEIYGVYELQVLEDFLRKGKGADFKEAAQTVAERIRRKIGYPELPPDPGAHRRFLEAFYAAERRHLEHHLLFGKHRERKR
jgi:uncharacterized RDD family membrane protein YckC